MTEAGSHGKTSCVRVVTDLHAMGIETEALATALASGHLTLGYLESAGRRPLAQIARSPRWPEIGVPFTTLERIYVAFGLLRPARDERVREEDLQVIKILPVLFGAGVEEGEVLRMARVWGDSARRVAQYLPHYFHTTVEERFRRRGLRDNQAFEAAIREVGVRAGRSGEDSDGCFDGTRGLHERASVRARGGRARARRCSAPSASKCGGGGLRGPSGYTQLTEESGDEVAAEISLTLAQLVNEIAARHRGSVVKMLGDGVHFHFRDPSDAVRGSLEIVERARSEGLPPAHVGVNAGPMIYDEGDYFGGRSTSRRGSHPTPRRTRSS